MKIVALMDIHGKADAAESIAADLRAADLVLLPGDLTNFGRRDDMAHIVDAIRAYTDNILAVMGNCDFPEVEEYLEAEGVCLHRRHRLVDGIAFAGVGGSLPGPVKTMNEWNEDQLADHLNAAVKDVPTDMPLVLMTHQPARDTVTDRLTNGRHVGSTAVREFIERRKPLLCFSGHIHEAEGTDRIGDTMLLNPGPFFKGRYAWAEISGGACRVEIRQAGAR